MTGQVDMTQAHPAPEPKPPKKPLRRLFRFRVSLVALLAGLVSLTGGLVLAMAYRSGMGTTLRVSEKLIDAGTASVVQRTLAYVSPVQLALRQYAQVFGREQIPDVSRQADAFFLTTLSELPHVKMMYVADAEGRFFSLQRQDDGRYLRKKIRLAPAGRIEARSVLSSDGSVAEELPQTAAGYDPRLRPWYALAAASRQPGWTSPYVFASTGTPGVTVFFPLLAEDGTLAVVVGADITLDSLSDFLRNINVSPHALTFIVNEQEEIVAWPVEGDGVIAGGTDGDLLAPVKVAQLRRPWISRAVEAYQKSTAGKFVFDFDGQAYRVQIRPLHVSDWYAVVIAPEDDFVGAIKANQRLMLLLCLGLIGLSVLVAFLVARGMSRPIEVLSHEMDYVRSLNLERESIPDSSIREIQTMSEAFRSMKSGLRAFRKYVPMPLVRGLIESGEDIRVGGHRQEATLLFADIRGFTTVSEAVSPETLVRLLSEYFEILNAVIGAEGGIVDKYTGDGLMAVWNAPLPDKDHALHACRAAVRIQRALVGMNAARAARGEPEFVTRIGIHTGEAVVGNVGTEDRMNYTVVGDAVNVAARLEGVIKDRGAQTLVSSVTRGLVPADFTDGVFERFGTLDLKGRAEPVETFWLNPSPEQA